MTPSGDGDAGSVRHRGRLFTALTVLFVVIGGALLWKPVTNSLSQGVTVGAEAGVSGDSTVADERVIVYYFHTTYRCTSCRNIEKFTREAIDSAFPAELADSTLVWRIVNIEEKGNEHFVKDYQLFTKSVVLVDERSGEWKNLPKVWQLLGDPNAFIRYIQTETENFLQGRHS